MKEYTQCEHVGDVLCHHEDDCGMCYFREKENTPEKIGIDGVMKQ